MPDPIYWYTVIDPNFYVDFEPDLDSGMTLEFEIGRVLSKNVNVWMRPALGSTGTFHRFMTGTLREAYATTSAEVGPPPSLRAEPLPALRYGSTPS
jgi:hypothetical protein